MEDAAAEEVVANLALVTGAPARVARDVLRAHAWDWDASVAYCASQGAAAPGPAAMEGAPAPGEDEEAGVAALPATQPMPGEGEDIAAPLPPLRRQDTWEADRDDECLQQALAESLRTAGVTSSSSRPSPERAHPHHLHVPVTDFSRDEDSSGNAGAQPSIVGVANHGGIAIRDDRLSELLNGTATLGRQSGRRRRPVALQPAVDLSHETPTSVEAGLAESSPTTATGNGHPESSAVSPERGSPGAHDGLLQPTRGYEELQLPDGINVEEAKMLEAAMLGIPYEGTLPHFGRESAPAVQSPLLPPSPTVLAQRFLREEQDAAFQASLQADRDKADAAARAQHEAEKAIQAAAAAADAAAAAEGQYQAKLDAKRAALAPEPAANDPEAVTVLVRLPTGQRLPRRFCTRQHLQAVFDFIDTTPAAGVRSGTYRLVTQFPRRVLSATDTLQDAGLTHKQEAVFLEPQ